jgi:FkbM family methyltransferase
MKIKKKEVDKKNKFYFEKIHNEDKKIVFFDMGANQGNISKQFLNKAERDKKSIEIHMFEPNIKILKNFKEKVVSEERNITFHHVCVDTIDSDEKKFFIGNKIYSTNSATEEVINKFNYNKSKFSRHIKVKSVDISNYLHEKCKISKKNFNIVKMDIEGTEWKVLEKLLSKKTFEYIDIILVEFHGPEKIKKSNILVGKINKSFSTLVYKEYSPGEYELFKSK